MKENDTDKSPEFGECDSSRPEEATEVVYRTGLHWVMLLGPALVMLLSGLSIPAKGGAAIVVLLFGTIWGVLSSISFETSELVVTADGRLRATVGFPWRRSYDCPIEDIQRVSIYQPSLGKVLGFGKLTVQRKNGKRHSFRMVKDPFQLGMVIEQRRQG